MLCVEQRLRVFENSVLGRHLGLRDEVTGDWRKLHEELHDFYCSLNFIRVITSRRIWHSVNVAHVGEQRCMEGFSKKSSRPRHKWKDNIKMYLKEIGWEGVNWITLSHNIITAEIL
jgi:hypothetical protein